MIKPRKGLILIKPDPEKQTTASGIWLSEESRDMSAFATVVETAEDITEVKSGDRIVYNVYGGTVVEDDLQILSIKEVAATL